MKIAIIFGGPAQERGISIHSARSVYDNLIILTNSYYNCQVINIYVDQYKQFYIIPTVYLYSSNPADFDFKLEEIGTLLNINKLTHMIDIVFPVIHGAFGEDGELQALLTKLQIPYIGSDSDTCQKAFLKHKALMTLSSIQDNMPYLIIEYSDIISANFEKIKDFFYIHCAMDAVIKPSNCGSSIMVYRVYDFDTLMQRCLEIFHSTQEPVLLEKYIIGREFSITVLQQGEQYFALAPIEIQLINKTEIFGYREKYLLENSVRYHTHQIGADIINDIQKQAVRVCQIFGIKDIVRLDGWILSAADSQNDPSVGHNIIFTDINIICGFEQNSLTFISAMEYGFTHTQILMSIINNACRRYHLHQFTNRYIKRVEAANTLSLNHFNSLAIQKQQPQDLIVYDVLSHSDVHNKISVYILMGGATSERYVSLMSGTNVLLKLRHSKYFQPIPYFLDHENRVWDIPEQFFFRHSTEEIYELCLELLHHHKAQTMLLSTLLQKVYQNNAVLFIALHGGIGENGTLQAMCETMHVPYNGANSKISALCIDKKNTGHKIDEIKIHNVVSLSKIIINQNTTFCDICNTLQCKMFVVKPNDDGCSTGVCIINTAEELAIYQQYFYDDILYLQNRKIPANLLSSHPEAILLPEIITTLIAEPYMYISELVVENKKVICTSNRYNGCGNIVEMTIGVMSNCITGNLFVFLPSITVASSTILSVEDKFQNGLGVNLTPPPTYMVTATQIEVIRSQILRVCNAIGIDGYCRIDIGFNIITNVITIIEINTLPALTPATILYNQAIIAGMSPVEFLENIINYAIMRNESAVQQLMSIS